MISVIVPVYNVEKYLQRCIDSIINQTYKDIEIILVDDGSTDKSGEICDDYAKSDARIKVIHKSNRGVSSARNEGLYTAKGKYIMFCDSDDYVDKNWCKILFDTINNNPYSFITSNYQNVGNNLQVQCEDKYINFETNYYQLFKDGVSPFVWNKIFDVNILKQYEILFNEELEHGEDIVFTLEYLKHCEKCIFIKEVLYSYVYNEQSLARKYTYDSLYHVLNAFYWRVPFIDNCYLEEYCDGYLYNFYYRFEIIFDKRNKMSFLQKMRYNNKMMNSEQFIFCLNHASCKNESPLLIKILKKHNYYLLWIFQKSIKLKNTLQSKF